MSESDCLGIPPSSLVPALDPEAALASLRTQAADRFDPVGFRFIEALARRARQQDGEVKRILDDKLSKALAAYTVRFEQSQNTAKDSIVCLENADQRPPLAALNHYLAQHSLDDADAGLEGNSSPRRELKTIRHFRNTWSKLSVDRQLKHAIEQAPENAGPLNSHMLVLRSLALMRDISPDYLSRFMSYADTLLWLDQADRK